MRIPLLGSFMDTLLPPARGKVGDRHGWRKLEQRRSSCRMGVAKIHGLFRTAPTLVLPLQGGGNNFLEHSSYFMDVATCGARQ